MVLSSLFLGYLQDLQGPFSLVGDIEEHNPVFGIYYTSVNMSIDTEKKAESSPTSISANNEGCQRPSLDKTTGEIQAVEIDKAIERSYIRKLDFYLLPYLSLMYLFNSVDRVSSFRFCA